MYKSFALFALTGLCFSSLACRDDPPFMPADLSVKDGNMGDGGMDDMAMKMYKAATINEIDTNPITGGNFGKGTAVSLTGVIVITPVRFFESKMKTRCDYEVIAQDPACTTPPCGLELIVQGPTKLAADMCPFANMSGTILKDTMVGDKLDVQGVVDNFPQNPPAADGGTGLMSILLHEVILDTLTKSGTGSITPTVITDGTPFKSYTGTAWATYEGMLLKVQPNGQKLTVTSNDGAVQPFQFHTNPGGTDWGTNFLGLYRQDAGTNFPGPGLQFTSITGAVKMNFGGAIHPRFMSDFVP